ARRVVGHCRVAAGAAGAARVGHLMTLVGRRGAGDALAATALVRPAQGLAVRACRDAGAVHAADAAAARRAAGASAGSAVVHVALQVDLAAVVDLLVAIGEAGVAGARPAVPGADQAVVVRVRRVRAARPVGMWTVAGGRRPGVGAAALVPRRGLDAAADVAAAAPDPDARPLVEERIRAA